MPLRISLASWPNRRPDGTGAKARCRPPKDLSRRLARQLRRALLLGRRGTLPRVAGVRHEESGWCEVLCAAALVRGTATAPPRFGADDGAEWVGEVLASLDSVGAATSSTLVNDRRKQLFDWLTVIIAGRHRAAIRAATHSDGDDDSDSLSWTSGSTLSDGGGCSASDAGESSSPSMEDSSAASSDDDAERSTDSPPSHAKVPHPPLDALLSLPPPSVLESPHPGGSRTRSPRQGQCPPCQPNCATRTGRHHNCNNRCLPTNQSCARNALGWGLCRTWSLPSCGSSRCQR